MNNKVNFRQKCNSNLTKPKKIIIGILSSSISVKVLEIDVFLSKVVLTIK